MFSTRLASLALLCQCGNTESAVVAVTEIDSSAEAGFESPSEPGAEPDAFADSAVDSRGDSPLNLDAGADATIAVNGPAFFLGADITFTQPDEASGATFSDNGTTKPILQLLKDHGFNYIRLRTFVDPTQPAPNPKGGMFAPYSTQGFGDLAHTITFGKQIKAAGMGFLLDFHYSDTWADPGKQVKPAAWVNDDIAAAIAHVHDYTFADIRALIDAGARPDMVQIGNEITPGMLLTPGAALGPTSPAGWPQLAELLNAGIRAVREIDPAIQVMLHLDRGGDLNSSIAFIDSAVAHGVAFDVFGESCYVAYQGPPTTWQATFNGLVTRFPNLKFIMAEYNADPVNRSGPELRQANDVIVNLPNRQGLGTFFWEPTRDIDSANRGMFTRNGNVFTPIPASINQYDQIRLAYGL